MAANDREFVFTLRANDLSTVPIQGAIAAIQKLIGLVNDQVEASTKGKTSLSDFTATVKQLETAVGDINKQRRAIGTALQKETELNEKAALVAQRRIELEKALASLQEGTSNKGVQANAIEALGNALAAAIKQQNTAQTAFDKAANAVKFLGLETRDYAAAQATLNAQLAETTETLRKAGDAQRDLIPIRNAVREADAKAAAAKKIADKEEQERLDAIKAQQDAQFKSRQAQARQEVELGAELARAAQARTKAEEEAANAQVEAARKVKDAKDKANASLLTGIINDKGKSDDKTAAEAEQKLKDQRAFDVADAQVMEAKRVRDEAIREQSLKDLRAFDVADAEAIDKKRARDQAAADAKRKRDEANAEATLRDQRALEVGDAEAIERKRVRDQAAAEATLRDMRALEVADAEATDRQIERAKARTDALLKAQRAYEISDAEAIEAQRVRAAAAEEQRLKDIRRFEVEDAQAMEAKRVRDAAATEQHLKEIRALEVADAEAIDKKREREIAAATSKKTRDQNNIEATLRDQRLLDIGDAEAIERKRVRDLAAIEATQREQRALEVADALAMDAKRERDAARVEAAQRAQRALEVSDALAMDAQISRQKALTEQKLRDQRSIEVADANALDTQIERAKTQQAFEDRLAQRRIDVAQRAVAAADRVRDANQQAGTPSTGTFGAQEAVNAAFPGRDTAANLNTKEAVEGLDETLRRQTVSAREYAKVLDDCLRIQARLSKDAGLVNQLKAQQDSLAKANADFHKYESELQALLAIQNKTTDQFNDLAKAQAAVEGAAGRVQKEVAAYNSLLSVTRARKIDENDLTGEKAKQIALAERLNEIQSRVKNTRGIFGLDSFQIQNLGYQINDVITQLSLGQGVFRTLESQGGQILQIFNNGQSTFLRMLPAIVAVGAALGFVGLTLLQIKERFDALRGFEGRLIAIGETGKISAAGLVQTQLAITKLGVSFGEAGEAINLFLDKGVRPDRMVQLAKAAQDTVDVFGGKFPDRIKEITSAFTGNYEAILKLDEQFHFLNVATRQQIKDAFDSGDAAKGQTIALEALSKVENEAATRSRSNYTNQTRQLTNAYHEMLEEFGKTGAIEKLIGLFTGLAQRFTLFAKLVSGGINFDQFQKIAKSMDDGTFQGFDAVKDTIEKTTKDIADLTEKRDEYLRVVAIIERKNPGVDAVPQALKNSLLDIEKRLAEAKAKLDGLKTQVTPSGETAESLRQRIQELNRGRDALLAGENVVQTPVPPPANTRTKEGLQQLLQFAAQSAGIDPALFTRLQSAENGRRNADGSPFIGADGNYPPGKNPDGTLSGAKGVLQLTQATFDEMKKLHSDITGNIDDDRSNALAGAYRFRQMLALPGVNGDAFKAVARYNTGPNAAGISDEARKEATAVTAGYSGLPVQSRTVSSFDEAIKDASAALAKLTGTATAIPTGITGNESPAVQAALQKYAEAAEKVAAGRRDASLRGDRAKARDENTVTEFQKDKLAEAQLSPDNKTPQAERVRAIIAEETRLKREELAKTRDEQQRQIEAEFKAIEAKARAEVEARVRTEREIIAFKNQLQAQATNSDKTDAEAQRRTVLEKYAIDIARLKDEAKKTGVYTIGGVPLQQYITSLEAARDDVLAKVTADAAVASVNKVVEERTAALNRIQTDFKAGLITVNDQFRLSTETVAKFAPRVANAVSDARKELLKVKQTPAVLAAAEKVDDVKTVATSVEQNRQAVKNGMEVIDRITSARTAFEALQKELVDQGTITVEEKTLRVKKYYEDTADAGAKAYQTVQDIIDQLRANPGSLPVEELDVAEAKARKFAGSLKYINPELKKIREAIEQSFTNRIVEAFDTVAQSVGNFLAGTASLKDVFTSVGSAFANMTAGILKDIATIILRTLVLKAVQAGLNSVSLGLGDTVVGAAKVAQSHAGGMVGHPGGQSRVIDMSVFRGARRLHSGGYVGLASDEVPTILQRGEQVLSKSQVRAQAGAAGGGSQSGTTGVRNVLAVGDKEIASAMTGQHGERVVLNILKRNAATVRKMI